MAFGSGRIITTNTTAGTTATFSIDKWQNGHLAGAGSGHIDEFSTLRGEVDNLRMRLEEYIAMAEKFEIETRYWRAKSSLLEKQLSNSKKETND